MGLAVQKHRVVYTLLRRGARRLVYKTGSKELQAGFCADFLEALGRKQISFFALIILICKLSMRMFSCFRGQIWGLRPKTKDWKAETKGMETRNITVLPQASYSTLHMFANHLWSFQSAYLNTGCTLHDVILRDAEIWRHGSWLDSQWPGGASLRRQVPTRIFSSEPNLMLGTRSKYTARLNTSSANLLWGTLLTST